ncbi:TPA: minor capsid protein [Streptococcus suis]
MASDYWKKRIRAEQLAKMERGATLGEEMDRLYSYHFNELEKEIRAFEQRYADKNGLSLAEVKARVDDFDVKVFEEKAKRYVAEKNFSARANSELALYNLKMKTNRLVLLQYNLDLELIALAEDERNLTERFLNDEFVKAIEMQSGLLGRSVLSASQIGTTAQAILNTPFHGANWSDNIWKRQTALREVVARMTERLLLQGKNPTTMVAQLRKEFNVTASEAKRLAVTEGARVATEGQKQAYIANGYDEYEFIAEPSACRECSKLDGKIFKVKDMEPGENAAPMHPWCHCSTGANVSESTDTLSNEEPLLFRRGALKGDFKDLKIPMRLSSVRKRARDFDIDLSNSKIILVKQTDLIGTGFCGGASAEEVGKIYLYPDAFTSEEQLVKTLLHENEHVRQYLTYGTEEVYNNPEKYELLAQKAEEVWYNKVRKR